MQRTFVTLGGLVLAVIAGLIVRGLVANPMESRRAQLDKERAKDLSEWAPEPESAVDFIGFQRAIAAKPELWRALVPPPVRREAPPNLDQMLHGVVVTRQQIGSGTKTKILVKLPGNPRGEWKGVGDEVKGVTIKKIAKTNVVFSLRKSGKEYTKTLPR